jgi:hypothetical protein
MSFLYPQIFSDFLVLSYGRYKPSVDETRCGISFGRCFGMWENVAKIFLFISFVHCKTLIVVCTQIPEFYQREWAQNASGIRKNSTSGCVDISGAKIVPSPETSSGGPACGPGW